MLRMGVPVATPIRTADCIAAATAAVWRRNHRTDFEAEVRDFFGVPFARSLNSGRAALFIVLQTMRQSGARDEVVLPAYACPSIGRAVVKAGLKPVLCDVGPSGSGLDLVSLEAALSGRTLAVVAAHLYGYPCDLTRVLELTHRAGAMLIEDAAQAFGAKWNGGNVGTYGDAGIFSFGMSKVLGTMSGGLAVTSNPDLAQQIDHLIAELPESSKWSEAIGIAKLGVLGFLVRRRHLGPLDAIWGSMLRGTKDCDDFDAQVAGSSQAAVAARLIGRLAEITAVRQRNAAYLASNLMDLGDIVLPEARTESEPVFLRFPVIAGSAKLKRGLLFKVRAQGVNASEMYSKASHEALRTFATRDSHTPQAEYLSDRMLNLPTHPFMRESDLAKIVDAFRSVLAPRRASRLAATVESTARA